MNIQNLMAQAQKMQKEISRKKEEIDSAIFEGESEWVKVKINGKKELQKIEILYQGSIENEDKEILEDMIKIAMNKATSAVDKEIERKMGAYGSSLNGLF